MQAERKGGGGCKAGSHQNSDVVAPLLVLRQIAKNTLKVEVEYVRSFLAKY